MSSPFHTLYDSTRGSDVGRELGEAIEAGLAQDGGLFLPRTMPRIEMDAISTDSFVDMSLDVMSHWLSGTEFRDTWRGIVDDALAFPVPIVPVDEDLFVCELFHGPTLSFKDFGARTMARLLGDRLGRTGESRVILVATSGDTGSAVADGFAGIPGIQVVLLYPGGGVSEVQERQLIAKRPGVHPFRVKGAFDDCQKLVKAAFDHPAWQGIPLSTANSINIARLLPQMLYYWWSVLNITRGAGLAAPSICVPSGNLGNLTAGVFAHMSGMPVAGFRAAHNANDFFPNYVAGKDAAFAATVKTLSNAMDVGAPSNFERLKTLLPGERLKALIQSDTTSDDETLETMRSVFTSTGYLADPHTAVGIHSVMEARKARHLEGPCVVMSTAHPAKFPDVCQQATGIQPDEPSRLADLVNAPTEWTDIEPDIDLLASHVRERISGAI